MYLLSYILRICSLRCRKHEKREDVKHWRENIKFIRNNSDTFDVCVVHEAAATLFGYDRWRLNLLRRYYSEHFALYFRRRERILHTARRRTEWRRQKGKKKTRTLQKVELNILKLIIPVRERMERSEKKEITANHGATGRRIHKLKIWLKSWQHDLRWADVNRRWWQRCCWGYGRPRPTGKINTEKIQVHVLRDMGFGVKAALDRQRRQFSRTLFPVRSRI